MLGLVCGECPSDWFINGQYCYHFHDITYSTSGMSWNDSRLACQRYGGDLVVIKDNAEQQLIARKMTPAQRRQHYWIGLTDAAQEGKLFFLYSLIYQRGKLWEGMNDIGLFLELKNFGDATVM